jgi:hypothetical protein
MEVIRELCSFEGRLAGTDAERRAANHLAERLRQMGRAAEVEPTYVHPKYGLVHAAHCALGFAGSLVAIEIPALGFGLVLLAATSMYLDLNYRLYVVRSLFFRRASQNVVSGGSRPGAPSRLILSAHLDTARSGAVFAEKRVRRAARLQQWLGLPLGPFRVLFWSLAALLPLLGARMAGLDSAAISLLQLPPTLALLVGVFALVEIELSAPVPGANDNATGVATVLALAAELDADPPEHLDVWVLLTGGEECLQEGMRAFLRAHDAELDRERTTFVCLDTIGHGEVRYEVAAGWVVTYEMDRRLVELCEAIATAGAEGDHDHAAKPLRHGLGGDSLPPRLRGYRSIGITCLGEDGYVPGYHLPTDTPDLLDPAAIERASAFTLALIRQLDRDAGRRHGTEGQRPATVEPDVPARP